MHRAGDPIAWAWDARSQEAAPAKVSPETANHPDSPKQGEKCSTCAQFVPPDQCRVVTGTVSKQGSCKLYAAKNP